MGTCALVDYNLTLSRLQNHIYHGEPYTRVDLSPVAESTLSSSQRLRIWPQVSLSFFLRAVSHSKPILSF
jgi:hypothetical protein